MGVLGGYNAESVAAADRLGGLNQNPSSPYHNDQYDAFRHAYTGALFADKFGADAAKWLGEKNEGAYDPNGKHEGMTQQQQNAEKNMCLRHDKIEMQLI